MGKKKSKTSEKSNAKKYEHQKALAAARQRKRKSNMTADQLEVLKQKARERYHRMKAERKIKLISDMTEKEKNVQRKKWKKRKAEYRTRKQNEKANTPPMSDEDDPVVPITISRQQMSGRKKVKRDKAKVYRDLKNKNDEIEKLRKQVEKYKKRLAREKNKNNVKGFASPSPSKKVAQIIGKDKVSPKIKKQLFIGLTLEKQLKEQMKTIKPKTKERQIITRVIGSKIIKKYRLQNQLREILSYKSSKQLKDYENIDLNIKKKIYNTVKVKEAISVQKFFEEDSVSRMLPGKKDFVRKGRVKKQRRILLDSLKNLHKRFLKEKGFKISYTTFTRCRPFWVTFPKARDRETCACIRHENIEFLVVALKKANIIEYKTAYDLVKSVVCSTNRYKCMMNLCKQCRDKEITFKKSNITDLNYNKWSQVTENKTIKGQIRNLKRVVKTCIVDTVDNLKMTLKKEVVIFKKHVCNMKHQSKQLKMLRENLKKGEYLMQVDFSQNYVSKCDKEIQSMHFGSSKRQISLHTVVCHYVETGSIKFKSFCTVSDHLDHHAHGVWAHLHPILEDAGKKYPNINTVHIYSDSPSSQYRNRFNIYFMKKLLPQYFKHLKSFTWNFSEPGHGKGSMDGVGGSIKRAADQYVLHGKDINCAGDLVKLFAASESKIKVVEVSPNAIEEMKKSLPQDVLPIKGIMSLRQVCWSKDHGLMDGRRLSCFNCLPNKKCEHFHILKISNLSTHKKTQTQDKQILKVSDVYTSDDDSNGGSNEKWLLKPKSYEYEDLNQGVFIVVSIFTDKKAASKNFLSMIQGQVLPEREVEVMFFKIYNSDPSMFYPDENDVSYISCDEIVGILPNPNIVQKGNRIFYKFEGPVQL